MVPGVKFSITTSAHATTRRARSIPPTAFRSIVTEYLLLLHSAKVPDRLTPGRLSV